MKVVTFGEIMLRLSPMGYDRFVQTDTFGAVYGGGEANVAVSLANFGIDAYFVTKLPSHEIGEAALNSLRRYGVHTDYIARGGDRLGIYYLEKGAGVRPSKVIYDRAYSSFACSKAVDFDWAQIFDGADWFHFTGITPALSDGISDILLCALRAAHERGIRVSCDLNYRKKLWSRDKANAVMSSFMPYVDVLIANEEDAGDVFGIHAASTDIYSGKLNNEGYIDVAAQLVARFGFDTVAITLRESLSASDNNWSAMLMSGGNSYFSKKYSLRIVDRVGGGDSFGAGLIYAILNNYTKEQALEFAVAASALKHTIEGDCNLVTAGEVNALAGGNGSGRVQR